MREVTPTKSTELALADERKLMRQGFEFLDEKRMLLAAELLRQLGFYQQRSNTLTNELRAATESLAEAVERHGLDNLQLYPVPSLPPASPECRRTLFLGIPLLETKPSAGAPGPSPRALDPSPETKACRAAFERLLRIAAEVATLASNLSRLAREYRRTDRRARALENVLLPEVEQAVKRVSEQLETVDQEEAIRARRSRTAERRF